MSDVTAEAFIELEAKVDAIDRALALIVQALERIDARVGEWDRE